MQTRAKLIVKGEVQRVGYRDAVVKIARKLNLKGFVQNRNPLKEPGNHRFNAEQESR